MLMFLMNSNFSQTAIVFYLFYKQENRDKFNNLLTVLLSSKGRIKNHPTLLSSLLLWQNVQDKSRKGKCLFWFMSSKISIMVALACRIIAHHHECHWGLLRVAHLMDTVTKKKKKMKRERKGWGYRYYLMSTTGVGNQSCHND